MKKMININFQGRIIPIEETSFDILKHYTESLRAYFANEEGRDEIINDIESRIAELFSERLKHTACITDEDVNRVIAGMGRPEDFEEAEATGNYTAGAAPSPKSGPEQQQTIPEQKLWRRSLNDKILGGVCGGIANYLKIDPAIVRVLFTVIAIGSFGFCLLVYILLWIILPAQMMEPNVRKRFYRSTDHRVMGGVAGGLSAYFGTDVWVPRLIFAAPLLLDILSGILDMDMLVVFFGGFIATSVIVYIILWIILPEARSASARLEMKGEKVNLQSIKNTIKEDPGVVIQPGNGRLGRAIGIMFKAFFMFIAGIISLAFITAFMAILFGGIVGGKGIYPFKDFIIENSWQEVLLWGSLLLFLAIPAIALLTWFIRRIFGIRSKRHYLGYTFGTLWLIGLICTIALLSLTARNFKMKESVEEDVFIQQPSHEKFYIKVKDNFKERYYTGRHLRDGIHLLGDNGDSLLLRNVRIDIVKSEDSLFHIHKLQFSNGSSSNQAMDLASRIEFPVTQGDSLLYLPKGFTINRKDKFRNQKVILVVEVPVGKKVEVDKSAHSFYWMSVGFNTGWDMNDDDEMRREFNWKANVEYIMTPDGLRKSKLPEEKGKGEQVDYEM